ncbi:MAG: cysteine synthase family protein [Oscillospiraceae bacterium]|jgi:cysteine synthase A|nr:cysteine synthase family protein [Oscillospiraceae bacterium]
MEKYITSIIQAIGKTPLLRLDRMVKQYELSGCIFAKLEHMNPSFSKKDRIALGMVEEAERKGLLKPGQPVLEMTSGNTGTGVALVCAAKGYRFICVLSRGNSIERVKMISRFGGEVVLVDQAPGAIKGKVSGADLDLVEIEAERLVKETGAFYLKQFNSSDNALSQEVAANEVWEQSDGCIQVFADFIGTGGTFEGYARAFKRHDPTVRTYVVEPYGCAYYKGEIIEGESHGIQGGGYAKELVNIDRTLIDGSVTVTHDEAVDMTRKLAEAEGIFAGYSSGANVMAAVKLLREQEKGKNICVVINDCGLKYMSTDLF